MKEYLYYVGGEFRKGEKKITAFAPAAGEVLGYLFETKREDFEFALSQSRKAESLWRKTPLLQRAQALREIAKTILDNLAELADLESRDVGKIMKESLFVDVPLAAECFNYYAAFLETLRFPTLEVMNGKSLIQYEPYGVAGIFLPYNVPLMIFGFTAAAALAAGNAVIIKPSELASLSLLRLAEFLDKLDLPKGLINVISGQGNAAGALLAESEVDILSFTGSYGTFKKVYAQSAKNPKKIICELGGSNISVIFKSADLEKAVENILAAAFMKQGQICIGTSLLLAAEEIYPKVKQMLKEKLAKIRLGGVQDASVQMGALISQEYLLAIDKRIKNLVAEKKAEIICGAEVDKAGRNFYRPTLLELKEVVWEEFFAPVLMLKSFKDEPEAEKIIAANPTGLTLQIWTKDNEQAMRLAKEARAGTVWINTFAQMSAATPFGGMKQSGWARVLGEEGFFEFSQTKHIGIGQGASAVEGWFGV